MKSSGKILATTIALTSTCAIDDENAMLSLGLSHQGTCDFSIAGRDGNITCKMD